MFSVVLAYQVLSDSKEYRVVGVKERIIVEPPIPNSKIQFDKEASLNKTIASFLEISPFIGKLSISIMSCNKTK